MTRPNREQIIEEMDVALAAGFIWNVDFQALKHTAAHAYETARSSEIQAKFCHDGKYQALTNEERDAGLPFDLHNVRSKKLAKLLTLAGDTEYTRAVRNFIETWGPVKDRIAALWPMVKKGRKPSTSPKATPERTLESTGTCACCGRNVKRREDGSITDHGYQVPWHGGGRTQGCFGVGYDPIEVSDLGLRAALAATQRAEENLAKTIENYEAGDKVLVEGTPYKPVTIKPGDVRYSHCLEARLDQLCHTLADARRQGVNYGLAILAWKVTPLPLEKSEDTEKRREAQEVKL